MNRLRKLHLLPCAALALMLLVPQPQWFTLSWSYTPDPADPVVFELWASPDLANWTYVGDTPDTSIQVQGEGERGFWRVRSRSIATGLESEWASGAP